MRTKICIIAPVRCYVLGRYTVFFVSGKSGRKNFLGSFFFFFCARKGQAYLKTLDVRWLLRFLNVLDQSCEMNKNCFDVIQICRVIFIQRFYSVSLGENNLSTEHT